MMGKKIILILATIILVLCAICQYAFYFFYDPYPIQNDLPLWFSIPRITFLIPAFIILNLIFRKKKFLLKQVVLLLTAVLVLFIVLIAPGKYIYVTGMKYRLNNFIKNNDMLERYINSDEKINKKIKLNWMAIAAKDKPYQVYSSNRELFIILYQQKNVVNIICLIRSDKEHNFSHKTEIIPLAPKWSLLIGSSAVSLSNEY